MMNFSCVICSELIIASSEVDVTQCGHMFHIACLLQWLERSKTCPQCRARVTEKTVYKVYFNITNSDSIRDDAETLQMKLDNLNFDLRLKEKDLKQRTEKYNDVKEKNACLRKEVSDLEHQIKAQESAMFAMKDQMKFFKKKASEVDRHKEEIVTLKTRLKDLENVQMALNGTREDVNKMIMNERSVDALALLAATLKKSLVDTEKRKRDVEQKLKHCQTEMYTMKQKCCNTDIENTELKLEIESLRLANSKLKTRRESIASHVVQEIIRKRRSEGDALHRANRLEVVEEISTPIPQKVRKIVESDSPYLAVKTNDFALLMNKVEKPKSAKAPQAPVNKFTIFKTENKRADNFEIPKHDNEVIYNGLGGSSKEDNFPKPKACSTMIKKSTVPASKMRKLAPPSRPLHKYF